MGLILSYILGALFLVAGLYGLLLLFVFLKIRNWVARAAIIFVLLSPVVWIVTGPVYDVWAKASENKRNFDALCEHEGGLKIYGHLSPGRTIRVSDIKRPSDINSYLKKYPNFIFESVSPEYKAGGEVFFSRYQMNAKGEITITPIDQVELDERGKPSRIQQGESEADYLLAEEQDIVIRQPLWVRIIRSGLRNRDNTVVASASVLYGDYIDFKLMGLAIGTSCYDEYRSITDRESSLLKSIPSRD